MGVKIDKINYFRPNPAKKHPVPATPLGGVGRTAHRNACQG